MEQEEWHKPTSILWQIPDPLATQKRKSVDSVEILHRKGMSVISSCLMARNQTSNYQVISFLTEEKKNPIEGVLFSQFFLNSPDIILSGIGRMPP